MLHLRYETPAAWTEAALRDPDALLLDHLFCEQKAAGMARAIERRFGARYPMVVEPMRALAAEEAEHAARCDRLLRERRVPHRPHHGNPYVTALRREAHRDGGTFLGDLIAASIIEARSCERFRLLADALRGETMGAFYADLFASEARHHVLFLDLATDIYGDAALRRLEELTTFEAKLVAERPWGSHIH